jgi:thymidylate synthase (FAD)
MTEDHVQLVGWSGDDAMVVDAARVSFDKTSENYTDEQNSKLIHYLAKNGHWTPFAHPHLTLRIKAPIFVRTQMFKHKIGFVENEVSRRYVDTDPEFWIPDSFRGCPTNGAKQGSNSGISIMVESSTKRTITQCHTEYLRLIEDGVAPEQARMVLPQCVFTEWYWTGSLAAYARFYKQRTDPHAQVEVQRYASFIGQIVSSKFPISWEALTESIQ